MAVTIACNQCGFDFTRLPVELKGARTTAACPLCHGQVVIDLGALRIFQREARVEKQFVMWRSREAPEPVKSAGGWMVKIGRLRMVFESLIVLEPREICHKTVPAFLQETGDAALPLLPVREEFFDCIDADAVDGMVAAGKEVSGMRGGRYFCNLPLKGLAAGAVESIQGIPLFLAGTGAGTGTAESAALRGINMRIWPNVDVREWSRYLVGLSAIDPEGREALQGSRRLRASCFVKGKEKWNPLDREMRGGDAFACSVEGRPAWVHVEVAAAGAESAVAAGGIFRVPPAQKSCKGRHPLDLAIDFGTSNTCMAFLDDDRKECLIPCLDEKETSLYIIRGGPEPDAHAGPDLWPPVKWFGAAEDLLPSEILLAKPRSEMTADADSIGSWTFGIDYGLPGSGISPGYAEEEHLLTEFKWKYMVEDGPQQAFASSLVGVQARYLEASLACALARIIASGKALPGSVNVTWSYPICFQKADFEEGLNASFPEAAERLRVITGCAWTANKGPNESRASALLGGTSTADLAVYLDMGGGSSDIAIENPRYDDTHPAQSIFRTSIRYAGAHMLAGYAGDGTPGSSCLAAESGIGRLRRQVRESKSIRDVTRNFDFFNSRFQEVLRNRTRHFYYYMLEYVARMVAAAVIERMAFRSGRMEKRLNVALYFLGNGWGFGSELDEDMTGLFRTVLSRRVRKILEDEASAGAFTAEGTKPNEVEFSFEVMKMSGVKHTKATVAMGLLRSTSPGSGQMEEDTRGRIGIVGYTTVVKHEDRTREIPWFRLTGKDIPPAEAEVDSRAMLDWEDNARPGFDTGIATPAQMDRGFNHTRPPLLRECRQKLDDYRWLQASPFEVMLEELFRRKIGSIGGGSYGGR